MTLTHNKLKVIFSITIMLLITIKSNAQEDKAVSRANDITEYIAQKIQLNEAQTKDLNTALLAKIRYQHEKTKDKNLSSEEKKLVYKQAGKSFNAVLSRRFSRENIISIKQHMSDFIKEDKPNT